MFEVKPPDKELAINNLVNALYAEKQLKERIREDTALLEQTKIEVRKAINDFLYAHTYRDK